MVTYFIRNNNNFYNEACDVASIKLIKDGKIYYGGTQWGDNNPSEIIDFIVISPEELSFGSWINNLGYQFTPPEE